MSPWHVCVCVHFPSVGEDAMEWLLRELETEEENAITEDLKHPAAMNLSVEEEQQFQDATACWMCSKALGVDPKEPRVRDHDHITGEFCGAAHQS